MHPVDPIRTLLLAVALAAPRPAAAQPAEWRAPAADVEADDAPEPAPPKKARAKKGKKAKPAATRPADRRTAEQKKRDALLAAAAAERAAITARAAEIAGEEGSEASARWLSGQAESTADPRVHLMAAETWLEVHTSEGRELARADGHAHDAARLAVPGATPPRIADDDVAAVRAHGEAVLTAVQRRRAALQQARRGRSELAAGSALLGVSFVGAGLMLGGATLHRKYRDEVDPLAGMEHLYDLDPLKDRYDRGTSMLAAGAIMTVGGAVLGATLVGLGARDLRQGRRQGGLRARLRVAPTPGGLVLSGRF